MRSASHFIPAVPDHLGEGNRDSSRGSVDEDSGLLGDGGMGWG